MREAGQCATDAEGQHDSILLGRDLDVGGSAGFIAALPTKPETCPQQVPDATPGR
jgi:hypothetical protein